MCPTIKKLETLFNNSEHFQLLVQATPKQPITAPPNAQAMDILGYLNPAHPFYVHLIGVHESSYLSTLSQPQQIQLIQQLKQNLALYLVFEHKRNIPTEFLRQSELNIVATHSLSQKPYDFIKNNIENLLKPTTSFHGSFVTVYGKGLLITGKSGAGKSSLVLSLLERGHLWICDDLVMLEQSPDGEIHGLRNKTVSEYIHVKGLGAINLDQHFGKAKRIPHHTLAAIIHLSDNIAEYKSGESIFTACKTTTILGKPFPQWCIDKNQKNQAILVESIAKQLILQDWGENAAESLIKAHTSVISAES